MQTLVSGVQVLHCVHPPSCPTNCPVTPVRHINVRPHSLKKMLPLIIIKAAITFVTTPSLEKMLVLLQYEA